MSLALSPRPSPPQRSSTSGLGLLSRIKPRDSHQRQSSTGHVGGGSALSQRSTSLNTFINSSPPRSSLFSLPPQEGAGVKARRLSRSLVQHHEGGGGDEFVCPVVDLDAEFMSASKIGRSKKCGSGASAACVKIMVRRSDKHGPQFAVKEFRNLLSARDSEAEFVAKVKSEYMVAKALSGHVNIVSTVCLATTTQNVHHNNPYDRRWNHVMEYCAQGDVFGLLEKKYFRNEDRFCIFKQILRAVAHLHDCGIAHRDIKLENCLMTDQGIIKLTDFGVSEVVRGEHPGLAPFGGNSSNGNNDTNEAIRMSRPGVVGSRPYISPEVLAKAGEYDATKLDVWSCGILFLTLAHNGNPWQSATPSEPNYSLFLDGWQHFLQEEANHHVDESNHPQCGPIFQSLTNSQRRCILRMLHPDPNQRCTIRQALTDRWVRAIECCAPDPDHQASLAAAVTISDAGAVTISGDARTGCCEMIDVSSKEGCDKLAARMRVQPSHDHLPPRTTTRRTSLIQHRFDMGDGTSRYD